MAPQSFVERRAVCTDREDEAEEFIRQTYVDTQLFFHRTDTPEPAFRAEAASTAPLAGDAVRSTLSYTAHCQPFDYFFFFRIEHGVLHCRWTNGERLLRPGDVAFYPLGVDVDIDSADLGARILRLPADRIARTAHELTDIDPADLRFGDPVPVSNAMGRYWGRVIDIVSDALFDDESPVANPLLVEDLARTVAVTALQTFPNSSMGHGQSHGGGMLRPATLRRAVAFIEENAHLPITVVDIAEAARVTPRALEYAFGRAYDTTPLRYLRRVRLEHAHRELQGADPHEGATVAGIAARWGFANPGRFAAYYRQTYGHAPHESLRA